MQSKAAFPVKKAACIDENIRRFPDKSTGQQRVNTKPHFIDVMIRLTTADTTEYIHTHCY